MKIGNVEVTPCDEVLVLPRTTGGDIVFKAKAVDMSEFNKRFPEPTPPNIRTRDGFGPDHDDKTYLALVAEYSETRYSYLVIKTLEASEIEWQQVDMDTPSTWKLWEKELEEAGFSTFEMNRISKCVLSANSLDEAKLEEARQSFLLGLAQ